MAAGLLHHVTQRGNGSRRVFFMDHGRQIYLETFFEYASRYSLWIWGYSPTMCLYQPGRKRIAHGESRRDPSTK